MCLVAVGHPFDTIKVRLQTTNVATDSALSLVRHTLKAEGVRGLYRGMMAPLLAVTPIFSLCFLSYDAGKRLIASVMGYAPGRQLTLNEIGIAGALSAIPTTAIMAPGERIKCILQVQDRGTVKFQGPVDVVRHIVRTEGAASMFRGSAATLARDGTGSYAYFGAYEYVKRTLTPPGQTSLSVPAVILGG